jgi:hypothetical protein
MIFSRLYMLRCPVFEPYKESAQHLGHGVLLDAHLPAKRFSYYGFSYQHRLEDCHGHEEEGGDGVAGHYRIYVPC